MAYDLDRVRERIQYIEKNLARLAILRDLPRAEFLADFRNVETAKHLLQTSIKAMMDIGAHILARQRLPTPQEGAGVFRQLGEAGLLPPERVPTYAQKVDRCQVVLVSGTVPKSLTDLGYKSENELQYCNSVL
jgi:uncharacterized protein YutE (UPF0331/DUF86 family)